ncbi:LAMI_0B07954g1_1 [Lachancea mirantina]|uniref:DNA ligase n=1 Tax=Lachancea mirantina TaxID=1230905 RepID=A0A1G4IXX0_9SACH|nr:LAMI_0B07954g1_1 [Lachancea mirantina]
MSVQEKNSENSSQHIRDAEPHNFAPSPDFKWLCDELYVKLDALLENRHKLGKSYSVSCLEVIIHFIKLWRKTVGNDFYEVFLLTFPYRDPRSYNIKDFTLIKAVCRYLNLPRNSLTENRLLSWKRLATRGKKLSAFCVEEIKKRRKEPEKSTRLTIESLNQKLSELSKESSTKKWGFNGLSQSAVFRFCLQNMTFVEMPYFFDILLKTRVVGGLEHKFLHCWHPDALDYLGVVSDLKLLSLKLWNAQERLGKTDLTINIGRAFSPQLARRMASSYESICRRLSGNFFVEEKMDGERIQVHYMQFGSSLKFFSRRGTDYTHLYGSSISSGVISRHVKLSPDVENCVLDGEMVTYDREKQTVLPFGIVKSSAVDEMISHEAGIDGKGFRPFFMIFDLLFLNGVSLTKVPLETRQEYLQTVINPVPNIIEVLKSLKCSDSNDIRNLLEKAISMGSEGIVLKQCSSIYSIGARNEAWIKVKPEYLEQFGENLDLIVIGRDPGKKDSFMCGLALLENDDEKDIKEVIELSGDDEGNLPEQIVETTERKFISFCSIANGISDEECKDIDRKTRGKWVKTSERLPPPELIEFGSKLPAEWIDPRESLVMEVKARSVNNSESAGVKFRSGSTLYGGYCRRIRDDKDWKSCATFRQYFQAKLSHNHMRYRRRIHNVSPRKKKRSSSAKMELLYGGLDTTQIQSHTEIFQGKRFYVLSDYTSVTDKTRVSYDRIISLVLHNGGSMVYNLDLRDGELQFLYIIGSKLTIECKALIERGYDIISPLWLFDSVRSQSALKLEPKHCFRVSKELLENAYSRVDKFGDSYESVMTGTEFDHKLISWNDKEITRKLKEACQDELMEIPIFLFYAFSAIVVNLNSGNQTVRQAADLFELFGGKITDDWLRANVIIVPSEEVDQTEMRSLREKAIKATRSRNETNLRLPHIVKLEWITACIEENCLVAEEEYAIL